MLRILITVRSLVSRINWILDLDEEDEVPSSTSDCISLLSLSDDETSDDDNHSSGNANESMVTHTTEASIAGTGYSSSRDGPQTQEQHIRNGSVVYPFQTIDILPYQTWYLRAGDTVELQPEEYRSGDFVYIMKIIENVETGQKYLRGLRLRRTRCINALNNKLNEVCLLLQEDEDDLRDVFTQGAVEVLVDKVLRPRNLIFSNKDHPQDSFHEILTATQVQANLAEIHERGRLVCRWVLITTFESAMKRKKLKESGGCLRRLTVQECTWGSFFNCMSNKVPSSYQMNLGDTNRPQVRQGKYSYGSGFCGAGGDSLGALWADLDVSYAWDSNRSACESIRGNFPRTTVLCCQAADFPPRGFNPRVDILHLSFPCQYFSPNHTKEGKNDDKNTEVVFNVTELLLKAKPIYHTQENTFGLHARHRLWLDKMLNMITEARYDVRWKVLNFADFGLPANRKRLIIYAARRGYPLPNFPPPTHDKYNRRYIYDVISNIPHTATWHLGHASRLKSPKRPYDARTTLAKCICTGGKDIHHPSGQRWFTPRELACIQMVPWNYDFYASSKKDILTQIGNLNPPTVWSQFLKQVVKTLDDFNDGVIDNLGNLTQAATRQAGPSVSTTTSANIDHLSTRRRNLDEDREIIMIDDEEDDDIVVVQSRGLRDIVDLMEE